MTYTLVPPTWSLSACPPGIDGYGLFSRLRYLEVGYVLMRDADGAWTLAVDGDSDLIKVSTAYYRGGISYEIDKTTRDDLVSAGYGDYITESV